MDTNYRVTNKEYPFSDLPESLNGYATHVYLDIYGIDEDESIGISAIRIAKMCEGMSISEVQECIDQMKIEGYIEQEAIRECRSNG